MGKTEWYEDDTPPDLTKYMNMSKEELDAEIARLEQEHKQTDSQK